MALEHDPAPRGGTLEGLILILPSFLVLMGGLVLVPVLPAMSREYVGTPNLPFVTQAILTVPSVMVVLFGPLAGILGDRFGRKKLLLVTMVVYSIVGLAPLAITSIYVLLASRVLLGINEAFVIVLATAMLSDAFSGRARDRWFGYQIGAGALFVIPLLAVSGFLGEFGWRYAFLIYALPLAMLPMLYFFTREREPAEEGRKDARDDDGQALAGFPWRHMTMVGAIGLFASVSFFVMQLQQGTAFSEIGVVSPERIGTLTAIASAGAPVGILVYRFITHWPPAKLLTLGFLATGLGLLGIAFSRQPVEMVASIFVGLIGSNILLPSLMSWAVRDMRYEVRARGVGIWQGVFAVGQFVSAMIFGAVLSVTGSAHLAFLVIAILVLIAAALSFATGRFGRR